MITDLPDIHGQLRALLDREGAVYRVLEHIAEGRTEFITQIRGNRLEQAILDRQGVPNEEMGEEVARGFERGEFAVDRGAAPREDLATAVGVGMAQPAFRRDDEAVGLECAAFAGEVAEDLAGGGLGKLAFGGEVDRRGEQGFFSLTAGGDGLGDGEVFRMAGVADPRDGAIARAEVDADEVAHALPFRCPVWRSLFDFDFGGALG